MEILLESDKNLLKDLYDKYKDDIGSCEEIDILDYIINHTEWSNKLSDIMALENICTYCDDKRFDIEYKKHNTKNLTAAESLLINTYKDKVMIDYKNKCKRLEINRYKFYDNFYNITAEAKFKYWINGIINYLNMENKKLLSYENPDGFVKRVYHSNENNILRNTMYIKELEDLLERLNIQY